jgi:hypothetical protein
MIKPTVLESALRLKSFVGLRGMRDRVPNRLRENSSCPRFLVEFVRFVKSPGIFGGIVAKRSGKWRLGLGKMRVEARSAGRK